MASHYSVCLIGAMDRLWFHQIILFPEPISQTKETVLPISESLAYTSSSPSSPTLTDEESSSAISLPPGEGILSDSSPSSPVDDSNNEGVEIREKERPIRSNLIRSRNRSDSSSPSARKRLKNLRNSGAMRKLHKTMSCKTLGELELEEVKGFMDLGFIFKKEHITPRMMSLVPGLQRIGESNNDESTSGNDITEAFKDGETEDGKEKRVVRRPYLSEAWFIRTPDSPFLNLGIPWSSAADDMKKHIKSWARTIASVVQQES